MRLHNLFKKTVLLTITAVLLFCNVPTVNALDYPETEASAAVLVEVNTGRVLYASNESEKAYPASTTKIMTALLVLEACERGDIDIYDVVTASNTYMDGLSDDGSTADIQPGEEMTVEDFLYCVLLASANEACNILAEYVAGSVNSFVDMMNERAAELGCTDTHFANTHGLPADSHYTTAWDLYLITNQALQYDRFVDITNTAVKTLPLTNKSGIRELENTNSLINPSSEYYYENASGVKTGYTKAAGHCLVSTATNDNDSMYIIAVIMGVGKVNEDGTPNTTNATSFSVTKSLYEWAFENYSYMEVLSTNEVITSVPVKLAQDVDSVNLKAEESLSILLPNDYAEEEITRNISLDSEVSGQDLTAPITAGQILGQITITYGGEIYGPINLVSSSDIELSRIEYMKSEIAKTFESTWVKVSVITVLLLFVLYIVFVVRLKIQKWKQKKMRAKR